MTLDHRQQLPGILFVRLSCGDKASDRDISAVILAVLFDFFFSCCASQRHLVLVLWHRAAPRSQAFPSTYSAVVPFHQPWFSMPYSC